VRAGCVLPFAEKEGKPRKVVGGSLRGSPHSPAREDIETVEESASLSEAQPAIGVAGSTQIFQRKREPQRMSARDSTVT